MRPTSTAIQLPVPSQLKQATPQWSAPFTSASPGQRKPQPAGSRTPWSAANCRAARHRSPGALDAGAGAGAGAGLVVGGAVTGGEVVRTGATVVAGRGLTVVDVVLVEVDVDDVVVLGATVVEVVLGSGEMGVTAATCTELAVPAVPITTATTLADSRQAVAPRATTQCRTADGERMRHLSAAGAASCSAQFPPQPPQPYESVSA